MKQRVVGSDLPSQERISVIVPVLNEAARIERCLAALINQPPEVSEILIVDGGSTDGTPDIVERWRARDGRLRWLDASPVDPSWTGKAWGLQFGLQRSDPRSQWILTLDADVEPAPALARSLLAHAVLTGDAAFSLATQQLTADWLDALIHPALLTTLVYRFGAPGGATRDLHRVQANGQCFIARRGALLASQAFTAAQASLCEDITIARRLAECGEAVGFYESDYLITVRMYSSWRDTWNNWPRSLPMRDQYFAWQEAAGLLKVLGFQALPLPVATLAVTLGWPAWISAMAMLLLAIRIGILFGVARAYPARPSSYWLSPLADLPAALRIIQFALRRRHRWRGRNYLRQPGGRFVAAARADSQPMRVPAAKP
jgi:dolichol-phosphate mannosyltransferase